MWENVQCNFSAILRWSIFGHFLDLPHPALLISGGKRGRDNFKMSSEYERGHVGECPVQFWCHSEVIIFWSFLGPTPPHFANFWGEGGLRYLKNSNGI